MNLGDIVDKRPFRPFTIELDNGRRTTVRHPENVFFIPNRIKLIHIEVYDETGDHLVIFEPSAISTLLAEPGNGNR